MKSNPPDVNILPPVEEQKLINIRHVTNGILNELFLDLITAWKPSSLRV